MTRKSVYLKRTSSLLDLNSHYLLLWRNFVVCDCCFTNEATKRARFLNNTYKPIPYFVFDLSAPRLLLLFLHTSNVDSIFDSFLFFRSSVTYYYWCEKFRKKILLITEIGQNSEKSPGDLSRLAVT